MSNIIIYSNNKNFPFTESMNFKESFTHNIFKIIIFDIIGKSSYTVVYQEYEEYLNSNTIIIEKKETSPDLFLEPGYYSYPFAFTLPQGLPSSFEHRIGKIRYTLTGTVGIPWDFDQHTCRSFTVIADMDLNRVDPVFRQPAETFGKKDVLFAFGGPITGYLKINKCITVNLKFNSNR